jgi:hypothetical protein
MDWRKSKYYEPLNPQTDLQQANRSVFAWAIEVWQSLSDEEKAPFIFYARSKPFSGYNYFIRQFMLFPPHFLTEAGEDLLLESGGFIIY